MNNKGLSTLTEILMRGKIYEISPSSLRKNIFLVTFVTGDQANIDVETYLKIVEE